MTAFLLLASLLLADAGRSEGVLPAVTLVSHEGREVRLDEMLRGRVVVISAFFTSCETTCPRVMRRLSSVQRKLGDRFGSDVAFASLSVDPDVDTVEKLAAYARRFGVRPGWELLTGRQEDIDAALGNLGYLTAQPENHSPLLLVVDAQNGTWRRAEGLGKPAEILRVIESVLEERD